MYTNVSNIVKTYLSLLERNKDNINTVIKEYEDRPLNVFEGMRKTLPRDAFPALEIEPQNAAIEWYSCRSQRPRYNFTCTLTVVNDNEDYGVEYIAKLTTTIVEILTDPTNLQMKILNEKKWEPTYGLVDSIILDSLVEDVTYNANKDGSIRTAEFSLFVLVHEPYPEWKWQIGSVEDPTIVRFDKIKPT
jgi:hypothetical protein